MCGIIGYVGEPSEGQWEQTHQLLESLFLLSEKRGRHATGFVATTSPYKFPINMNIISDKQAHPASQFIKDSGPWRGLRHRRCSMVLGHVRYATHGSPAEDHNNHPHEGASGLWLVHNGVLIGHETTARQYRLLLQSDCDSEVILRLVETTKHPADGLRRALQIVHGSMAVAMLDVKRQLLWLARNDGRPLWVAKMGRRWFIASEREILINATHQTSGNSYWDDIDILVPLASGHIHALSPLGRYVALEV
ncbi:hypothetical protein HED60_05580 [Planctomycetales bacterium ZRK34]|nr:hypothetical protein HED60_05580 [Planctomycetales bacterium ZRK34]